MDPKRISVLTIFFVHFQSKKHEAAVKQMIGEMPSGVPHNSRHLSKPELQQEQEGDDDDDDS